jgi:hypothetical protein
MTVAKAPPDNRSVMEQWHDLLRDMEAAGAIEITPHDPHYQLLGIANKSNGDIACTAGCAPMNIIDAPRVMQGKGGRGRPLTGKPAAAGR